MKYTSNLSASILLVIFGLTMNILIGQNSNNFEIGKNLDIFSTVYKELNINYVDEVGPGELMETGIDAMLESLDPYTVYIPESEIEDVKFITTGQYGGIGALIQQKDDYVVISEPYEGKPAQKAGLKAGDIILEIDGKSATGKSTSDVSAILKGQAGIMVKLKIERPGTDEPFEIELERANVKIDNIPYYGMVSDNVGYIKLTGFTRNAGKEVKDAFIELKDKNELHGIILDLRGNGGGLLQEAVNITNIFEDKDHVVVSTKGKLATKNHTYKTSKMAVDNEIPLVILVDNNSASASEIVAGAIQDLDRGVVIGERTFGKGLVQNVIPLTYNSQMKITVAKYYIPSGRCIQEIDYTHKDKNGKSEKVPDSLITAFKTKNGRTVYDGGGIEPDILSERDEMSKLSMSLFINYLFFDFATEFVLKNPSIAPADEFVISDEIYLEFNDYIADKDYDYSTQCEETLENLKEHAEEEGYFESITEEYEALFEKFEKNKKGDITKNKDEIKKILRFEIISRYYYQRGKIISSLADDKSLKKAVEIINANGDYLAILQGNLDNDKK
ncbi:MAG: peptidase S41 [Bacteroidetes bacterium]|nr:MAG: peptidase S41 [Bacteroidota bacterium]